MRTQFLQNSSLIQQKGQSIPILLQERVEVELNKLADQKQIMKLNKNCDKQFISSIVKTVEKTKRSNLRLTTKTSMNSDKKKQIPTTQYWILIWQQRTNYKEG